MTTVHFRPKYDIEQYLVQFSFPSPLDSFPTISVDVESGDASDAESFAGLPIWQGQGADVFIRITGGTAGCVYRITCSSFIGGLPVSRSGLIAVMPTTAEIPTGTPPAPLVRYYTTPPYPIHMEDSLGVRADSQRGMIFGVPSDELNVTALTPLGGDIRSYRLNYDHSTPEDLNVIGIVPLGGDVKDYRLRYDHPIPEDLNVTGLVPLGGDIQTVVIRYENWLEEDIDVGMIALGGNIT